MHFGSVRSEQQVFADLETLCVTPGFIHILAALSVEDNIIAYSGQLTQEVMAASYTPARTIRSEFATLFGLMLKAPVDFGFPGAEVLQERIKQTRSLLAELHACLGQGMFNALKEAAMKVAAGESIVGASPLRRGNVLREPFFYSGDAAYNFQYRDFAIERYASDDDWLVSNRGFAIAEAAAVAEAIGVLSTRKLTALLTSRQALAEPGEHALKGFSFTLAEVTAEAGLTEARTANILRSFTAPAPPANQAFASISDFNIAAATPILPTPAGDYICLDSYGVTEALYDSPYYWMAADREYRSTAAKHRGDFTEAFVARRLAAVFGSANVHRGVNILKGGRRIGEFDVLVLFADRAIVVQCKSKKLTLEARKGNDLQLQDDFKKAVQDSYDQAFVCASALGDETLSFVRDADGTSVAVPQARAIFPLCVVSDHYPALSAQTREFLKFVTDERIQSPLVCDIFLVDVLAEMLATPLYFLDYIRRRAEFQGRVSANNELTVLSLHLQQNLWFEKEFGLVSISEDMSHALDTAMTVRRTGAMGTRTPEGILTMLRGTRIGQIVSSIERSPEPDLVDLGFILLSMNGESIESLEDNLQRISALTRLDGKHHTLSMTLNDRQGGLTVHCNRHPDEKARAMLHDHCRRRKYFHKAGSWAGLAIRPEDALPRFSVQLNSPWKYENELEKATAKMRKTSPVQTVAPRSGPKVGRNDPCPCGSGLKAKKCCHG